MSESGSVTTGALRMICLAAIGSVAILILYWMYTEQEKISLCTQFGSKNYGNHEKIIMIQNKTTPPENKPWNYNWDQMHTGKKEDIEGVPTKTLILVRHGKYDLNTGDLNELGRKQANMTGMKLREMGMPYGSIIHSTMPRAKQTADLIHQHLPNLPMYADDLLIEGGPIPPNPTVKHWGLPERTYHVDGPRMEAGFRKYFFRANKEQKYQSFDIIVGHGNLFRFFALKALQLPIDAWMRVFIGHASITVLHINPDGTVTMTHFGDVGHFPKDMFSW